jgi:hypothetical protein
MNLRDFVERTVRLVSRQFDQRGEVPPIYHIITGDGEDLVVPGFPGDKDLAVALARVILETVEATRYVFVTEGWVLFAPDSADIDKINREGVEAQPGRKEVLMFSAEDELEGVIMGHREIIRDGARARLGPLEVIQYGQSEGRMVGLLPRKKLAS